MQGSDPARTALLLRSHIKDLQDSVSSIEVCAKPVVAAVHGVCFGAGLDLISACDVRYAATNSNFSIKVRRVGLQCGRELTGRTARAGGRRRACRGRRIAAKAPAKSRLGLSTERTRTYCEELWSGRGGEAGPGVARR